MLGKPYDNEELSRIKALYLQGFNLHAIAEQLSRSDSSVFNRAKAMGLDTGCNHDRGITSRKAWETRRKKYGKSGCLEEVLSRFKEKMRKRMLINNPMDRGFSNNNEEAWKTRRRKYGPSGFSKGHPWIKGRTKENNEKLKETSRHISKVRKRLFIDGSLKNWNDGLTKETDKRLEQAGKKISKAHKGKKLSKEHKKRIGRGLEKAWANLEFKEMMRKKRRKSTLKLWQKKDFRNKIVSAMAHALCEHPNKPESELRDLLEQMFPSEYRFTGDGSFILAGKCPDFLNVNGKKKIIELFGDYWHEKTEEKQRIALFKEYGYDTLIVWDSELDNVPLLSNKLVEFHNVGVHV